MLCWRWDSRNCCGPSINSSSRDNLRSEGLPPRVAHVSASVGKCHLSAEDFFQGTSERDLLSRSRLQFWFAFLLNFLDLLRRILVKCVTFKTWNLEAEEKQFTDFLFLTDFLFPEEKLSFWAGNSGSQKLVLHEPDSETRAGDFCSELAQLVGQHNFRAGLGKMESSLGSSPLLTEERLQRELDQSFRIGSQKAENKKIMNLLWNATSFVFAVLNRVAHFPQTPEVGFHSPGERICRKLRVRRAWLESVRKFSSEWTELGESLARSLLSSFRFHLDHLKSLSKKQQFLKYFSDDKKFVIFKSCVESLTKFLVLPAHFDEARIIVSIFVFRKCRDSLGKRILEATSWAQVESLLRQEQLGKLVCVFRHSDSV